VKTQLDGVDNILNPDVASLVDISPDDPDATAQEIQENLGLNAEHRLLGKELKALESQYEALAVNHP